MSGKSLKGAAKAVPRAYDRLSGHGRDTVQVMLDLPLRVRVPLPARPRPESHERHERGVLGIPDGPAVGVAPFDHAGHVVRVSTHSGTPSSVKVCTMPMNRFSCLALGGGEFDVGRAAVVVGHREARRPRRQPCASRRPWPTSR